MRQANTLNKEVIVSVNKLNSAPKKDQNSFFRKAGDKIFKQELQFLKKNLLS